MGNLVEANPDAVLDMIVEALKLETDPAALSYLSAGPLEDVVNATTIDRIAREAATERRPPTRGSASRCAASGTGTRATR